MNETGRSSPSSATTRADAMLSVLRTGRQVQGRDAVTLPEAYAVLAELRALRVRAGEKPVGRKIGFTNRTIWPEYGVFAPIWGDMYDTTVRALPQSAVSLHGLMEPRIEPEIAFTLARAPAPDMSEADLFACVRSVCLAYEIVQSPYPDWKFSAAEGVVGAGLHGALYLGPQQTIADRARWLADLRDFSVELSRGDELMDTGRASNVLDGPVSALRHLVQMLAEDRHNPPLAAGEIVTTGTLTRAFPVKAGERWHTRISGLPLADIAIAFA